MRFRDDGYRIWGALERGDVKRETHDARQCVGQRCAEHDDDGAPVGVEFCVVEYKHSDAPRALVDELRRRLRPPASGFCEAWPNCGHSSGPRGCAIPIGAYSATDPLGLVCPKHEEIVLSLCAEGGCAIAQRVARAFLAPARPIGEVSLAAATVDELAGVNWWNELAPDARSDWLERAVAAGAAPAYAVSVADAWAAFKRDKGN